jgi:hypothetical protein
MPTLYFFMAMDENFLQCASCHNLCPKLSKLNSGAAQNHGTN